MVNYTHSRRNKMVEFFYNLIILLSAWGIYKIYISPLKKQIDALNFKNEVLEEKINIFSNMLDENMS